MTTVVRQLRSWQLLEVLFSAFYYATIFIAVAATFLGLACLADWYCDRFRDTPLWLRTTMTAGQIVIALMTGVALLWCLRKPSLDSLAAKAETAIPQLGHRLVTALQLNRPEAKTAGMSQQLISEVTQEADTIASKHRLTKLADKRPLLNGFLILLPLVLIIGGLIAWKWDLIQVLLKRQALMDVEIPRLISIENRTKDLHPSGDAVELDFVVHGPADENTLGRVRVTPEGQPSESYDVRYAGKLSEDTSRFVATLPPSSQPFKFSARIGDGRMRKPGNVRFEPRPIVNSVVAFVQMPDYVDPAGKRRFERLQVQGEVFAPADASVRVAITSTKPVAQAKLTVLGRDEAGSEKVLLERLMNVEGDRSQASIVFDLPERPSGYRIDVIDENGFVNLNPPRRGITIMPDEAPLVELLTEVLTDTPLAPNVLELEEVNGMPLVLGGDVQIGYRARSPLGLARAYIIYRVNEGPWSPLPLAKVSADETKVGRFVPELGVFATYLSDQQVEFYLLPSRDPEHEPDGLTAGGRFNFKEAALKKIGNDGRPTKLEIGDRVELYVAVYDRKPGQQQDPINREGAGRVPGVSESRIKAVVTASQLEEWTRQRDQSRDRLRRIEDAQRGVFGQGKGK